MSMFDGIENVKTYTSNPALRPGPNGTENEYDLTVIALEKGKTPVKKSEFFRATFEVDAAKGTDASEPDSSAEFYVQFGDYPDSDLREIAKCMSAVVNDSSVKLDPAGMEVATSSKQPLKGQRVRAYVSHKRKKTGEFAYFKSGQPILKYRWAPLPNK